MTINDEDIFKIFHYCFVFAACFLILSAGCRVLADPPHTQSIDSYYRALSERVEKGVTGPIGGWHYYYKNGFHIDSREKNLEFEINGRILVDGGNIDADTMMMILKPK